jgi:hypothetical protein
MTRSHDDRGEKNVPLIPIVVVAAIAVLVILVLVFALRIFEGGETVTPPEGGDDTPARTAPPSGRLASDPVLIYNG